MRRVLVLVALVALAGLVMDTSWARARRAEVQPVLVVARPATSVTPTASVDLVIVLDRSSSMSSESGVTAQTCSLTMSCQPFESVRASARWLVDHLDFPNDRVAIVAFSRHVLVYDHDLADFRSTAGITDTAFLSGTLMVADRNELLAVLDDNTRFSIDTCDRTVGCSENDMPGTGWGPYSPYTANTNLGGAIRVATNVLAAQGRSSDTTRVMLLLSDGVPNATDPWGQFTGGFCPPTTWTKAWAGQTYTVPGYIPNTSPLFPYAHSWCRRTNVSDGGVGDDVELPYNQITRACLNMPAWPGSTYPACPLGTTITDTTGYEYDAADYMRDQADNMGNNGIVAFAIGLGRDVADSLKGWSTWKFVRTGGMNQDPREPNAGERLLRYVADAGSPPGTWPCHSDYWTPGQTEFVNATPDHHCGNYWYAENSGNLPPVLEAVVDRIKPPNLMAVPTSGVRPLTVAFTGTSAVSVTGWLWDFGDGITGTQQSPTHTYLATGNYTVTLGISGTSVSDVLMRTNYITVYMHSTIELDAGWNLFAIPLQSQAPFTAQGLLDSFNDQGGNCTEVDRWLYGGWDSYLDQMGFNDFEILLGQSYFVNCAEPVAWHLQGYTIQTSASVSLETGWNLLSVQHPFSGYQAQSVLDAIAFQGGDCREIDRWLYGGWDSYLAGMDFNNFDILPHEGYFVKCDISSVFMP